MGLKEEIENKTSKIHRDSYQMSIGELINIYKDSEMDIHPEFQRVFRWSEYQKTKLIESIMLNIPIPSIFVSQNDDGVWDIIDGVQRLSTIFQFVGIFKNEKGELEKPLILQKTDYLPSFEGKQWNGENEENQFSNDQKIDFKRARIDIIILKKESDPNTKYELFQRLNTGGTFLSGQEVRNCLMIMTNKTFYEFVKQLENEESYRCCVPISDRKEDEQYRMELILRLFIALNMDLNKANGYQDLTQLLDKETLLLCDKTIDYDQERQSFIETFRLLKDVLDENTFKIYAQKPSGQHVHHGPFLSSAFQSIAVGVFKNLNLITAKGDKTTWLKEKIEKFYTEETFLENTKPGVRAIPRFKELSLFGMDYFKP